MNAIRPKLINNPNKKKNALWRSRNNNNNNNNKQIKINKSNLLILKLI